MTKTRILARLSRWENLVMMELIKTFGLRPGVDLFFYRDQNGVEIDFVVEKKGVLSLIEAKAGERIHPGKFNFEKVAPLFQNRFRIVCLFFILTFITQAADHVKRVK